MTTLISQSQLEGWTWRGHSIQYCVTGSGQPLLLIHGFGASIGHWRKNIPVLAAAGYQVFALDLIGFGGSDKPALDYSLDLFLELLVDFWQTHIQKPTVVIGNSIGALLSLMMATHYPEAVASSILLNCSGGLNHRPDELKGPIKYVMMLFTTLVTSKATGPFLFNRVRQKSRIRNTLRQVYCDTSAITDELVEILYQPSCDAGAQQVFASILSGPAGTPPETMLPKVERPILVLWGEKDPWTPIQRGLNFQQYVNPAITYQFIPIPNAGHCPHDEHPDLVNQYILEWLSTVCAVV